jgi:2-hydroxycyclohexanecarboxyl-CoA dehydrogenase
MELRDAMTKFTFDLSGRTALVTGAGQGVGREIALTLASHGARVAVNDFVASRAEAVAGEIEAAGGRALGLQADVADFDGVLEMAARTERDLGPIDILVNNAGNAGPDAAMPRLDFWTTDPAEWDRYLAVNLRGVMVCARACAGGMVARKFGRIITIVSDAGRTGEQGFEAYSAAKAGAAGFSRALARSLGRYEVTVNTISLSNMARDGAPAPPEAEAMIKEMLKRYIIRRQGSPVDVAAVALLLASDASSWITGQTYPVNGGFALAL